MSLRSLFPTLVKETEIGSVGLRDALDPRLRETK